MTKLSGFISFMSSLGDLKDLPKTGWVIRGLKDGESVADHSFGVTLLALLLADKAGVYKDRSIKMALVHDLAECKVGDLTPADGVPKKEKHKLELKAFKELCANLDNGSEMLELYKEYELGKTPEAIFVKRLDKLDMMFQVHKYNSTHPEINLEEFWEKIEEFDFGNLIDIYQALKASHTKK